MQRVLRPPYLDDAKPEKARRICSVPFGVGHWRATDWPLDRPRTRFVYLDTADLVGFPIEMRNTVPASDGASTVPPTKT